MIPFNIPPYVGTENGYIADAIQSHKICGDGAYTKKCQELLEQKTGSAKVLLINNGTEKFKMIAPVWYADMACEMDTIMDISNLHNPWRVKNVTQGVTST